MSGPVLLIRHAQSEYNADGRWQGLADPPLSSEGRRQAESLADALRGATIDVLIASDLVRALQTAEIVGRAVGRVPERDPRLREMDLGVWGGLTRREIESRHAADLRAFDSGDPDARATRGECRRELRERVRPAVADILGRHPDRAIAIVTHLGVIEQLSSVRLGNAEFCELDRSEVA